MNTLPRLRESLVSAAERQVAHAVHARESVQAQPAAGRHRSGRVREGRGLPRRRRFARRGSLALALALAILSVAAVAYATTLFIQTGSPIRPSGPLNPLVGEGVPAPGASRLLSLRVPDPEGGLPWGMRIVRTTRGEVCEQIGRVDGGQLGELGIDGVFHNDGRFHPLPTDVLPETSRAGTRGVADNDATETVSCQLAGQMLVGEHIGVDRSAGAADGGEGARPRSELRDIYFGLLGAPAVSVTYRAGKLDRTVPVLRPAGAYLIVRRTIRGEQVGTGDESLGSEGDLPPSAPLTAIAYQLNGKLCNRGPVLPPGVVAHLTDLCPTPSWPSSNTIVPRELHQPLHSRLVVNRGVLVGVRLSYKTPFAVTSAKEDYEIRIPGFSCNRTGATRRGPTVDWSGSSVSLGRDVTRGATVTHWLSARSLFAGMCGFPPHTRHASRRSAVIEVLYRQYEGAVPVIVGSAVVKVPDQTLVDR
jgi:hypothetical protein